MTSVGSGAVNGELCVWEAGMGEGGGDQPAHTAPLCAVIVVTHRSTHPPPSRPHPSFIHADKCKCCEDVAPVSLCLNELRLECISTKTTCSHLCFNLSGVCDAGHQKQVSPDLFRVFYTIWKETEAEAQEVCIQVFSVWSNMRPGVSEMARPSVSHQ